MPGLPRATRTWQSQSSQAQGVNQRPGPYTRTAAPPASAVYSPGSAPVRLPMYA
jgi:hypothetical protein